MLYLTENDVRSLLPMDECVRLMRETFEALANGTALNQPRRRLFVPTGAVLHSMAGAIGNYFGTKITRSTPNMAPTFSSISSTPRPASPWPSWRRTTWARSGPAQLPAMPQICSPRRNPPPPE